MNLYQQDKDGNWEKIDLEKIKKNLKRGEIMELPNIRIGYWVKDPLVTRVVITKLTEEQEEKRQSYLNQKKEEREEHPFCTKKCIY